MCIWDRSFITNVAIKKVRDGYGLGVFLGFSFGRSDWSYI